MTKTILKQFLILWGILTMINLQHELRTQVPCKIKGKRKKKKLGGPRRPAIKPNLEKENRKKY